jgi:hypothetical protein
MQRIGTERAHRAGLHDRSRQGTPAFAVSARLAHDADGDMCRALISEDLHFDLAPLRRHYQEAYGQGPGVIAFILEGWRITYEF